jgi:thioredoxin-like negative regulator of GroEL
MKTLTAPRLLFIAGIFFISAYLLVQGLLAWRSHVINARDERAFHAAQRLLAAERPREAFAIIRSRNRHLQGSRPAQWLSLEIETLATLRHVSRLLNLHNRVPAAVARHEGAALLTARALLHAGNRGAFSRLRDAWRSGGKAPAAWFALDVDALLVDGQPEAALEMLHSRSFADKADASRLTRLALLTATDDLHRAWQYLARAHRLAPKNPDVRSFRAQILEQIGKPAMARVEYVAAHLTDPDNPLFLDQLAEFYRRSGNLSLALKTWTERPDDDSADFIRRKALFWSRVGHPVPAGRTGAAAASGDRHPFVGYLQGLPPDRFWDAAAFREIPEKQTLLNKRQETFWLRLLQALKDGEESGALALVRSNPFREQSWHPDIETALEQVLVHRAGEGTAPAGKGHGQQAGIRHQFFDQLDRLGKTGPVPRGLDRLLASEAVFAAVFMAGGWVEAALQLHRLPVLPDDFPDWVAYGLTQSLRFNRGSQAALDFAEKQTSSPVMALLGAELRLAVGRTAEGLTALKALAGADSDVGFRSAWLLALARLDRGDAEGAHAVLARQPRLQQSVTGGEIRARIALLEGDTDRARRTYAALAPASAEAKAYLARRAYAGRDWATAKRFTEALLREFPDQMQFRANWVSIIEAGGAK